MLPMSAWPPSPPGPPPPGSGPPGAWNQQGSWGPEGAWGPPGAPQPGAWGGPTSWGPGYPAPGSGPATSPAPPPWSPGAIAAISFFCTFLPAAILHTLNWSRLGRPRAAAPWIAVWAVGFAAFMALAFATTDEPAVTRAFGLVNFVIAGYFYKSQSALFDAHTQRGGQKAKIGLPAVLSVGWAFVFLGAAFAYGYVQGAEDDARFEEARVALEGGDYAAAEPVFKHHRDEYDDPAASYNLALVYLNTERFDEARAEHRTLTTKHSGFEGLDELLEVIDDAQNDHAVKLMDEGKLVAAEAVLRKLRLARPDYGRAAFNLAILYRDQKKYDRAKKEIDALRKIDPDFDGLEDLSAEIAELVSPSTVEL